MNKLLKIVKDNKLVVASSRRLPLIAGSFLFIGYNHFLKERAGYSYGVIAGVGEKDKLDFLINEDGIGDLFNKNIKVSKLFDLNKKFKRLFIQERLLINKNKKEADPFKVLKAISSVYSQIICPIGFYNSIMRYVKNDAKKAKKIGQLAFRIAKDKDVVANFIYAEVEPLIQKCANRIGKKLNLDGDLLRYLTVKEFNDFLENKSISKNKLAEISKRRKGYLYVFYKGKDLISTDKKIINQLRKNLSVDYLKSEVVKGVTAYPGKAKGRVLKSFHGIKNFKPNRILVANITKPQDVLMLKKFLAIVTDEGGVLSHVAVVAREFKIPSVMSTKVATKVFKDGDLVEVDAGKGTVKKISK